MFIFSNLARDCILIDKTTQSLPLTINFRQIGVGKLRKYLEQNDFADYLTALNLTNEDDLKEKLMESDFEWKPPTGERPLPDYSGRTSAATILAIFLAMMLFKFGSFVFGNYQIIICTVNLFVQLIHIEFLFSFHQRSNCGFKLIVDRLVTDPKMKQILFRVYYASLLKFWDLPILVLLYAFCRKLSFFVFL